MVKSFLNFYCKNAEKFSERNAKHLSENSITLPKNHKKTKIFHSVMTSMTMLTPNQNPFNFVVSQKFKQKSAQIRLTFRMTKSMRIKLDGF